MKHNIKHVWFDLSETLAVYSPEFVAARDELLYRVFAEAVKKRVSDSLIAEYKELYKKHGSNAAVFRTLGFAPTYWPDHFKKLSDSTNLFKADPKIYGTLDVLRKIVPISLFTNARPEAILRSIKIDPMWFTYIVGSGDFKEPKPALDGFRVMIAKSKLPADQILYIGDMLEKDIRPAKKVGMKAGLVWGSSPEADYAFESFEDILKLFL